MQQVDIQNVIKFYLTLPLSSSVNIDLIKKVFVELITFADCSFTVDGLSCTKRNIIYILTDLWVLKSFFRYDKDGPFTS